MDVAQALAQYILALEGCARTTKRSEDRPLYEKLLADAAGILASVVAPTDGLANRLAAHERLWGYIWLHDPVSSEARLIWESAIGALMQSSNNSFKPNPLRGSA